MSESTGARHYVLFPDVKNAQALYELMKAAGVRCTFAPTPREADRCYGLAALYCKAEWHGLRTENLLLLLWKKRSTRKPVRSNGAY